MSVRRPDPQYEEQLLPAAAAAAAPHIHDLTAFSASEDEEPPRRHHRRRRVDDEVEELEPEQGACKIAFERVVGPPLGIVTCCVEGGDCCAYVPTTLLGMPACSHLICTGCFARHKASVAVDRALTCPACRAVIPRVLAVSQLAMGIISGVKVTCEHAACDATFDIGVGFSGVARHLRVCAANVSPCVHCQVPMNKAARDLHVCPMQQAACPLCHEKVARRDVAAHVLTDTTCVGLVPCPLGCVVGGDAGHPPHAKRAKSASLAAERATHTAMVPRTQVEQHKLVCPCRPVACPFAGCAYELLQHEVAAHMCKPKYQAQHLALMTAKPSADRMLEALRVTPFPGMHRLADGIMNVTTTSLDKRYSLRAHPRVIHVDQADVGDLLLTAEQEKGVPRILHMQIGIQPPMQRRGGAAAAAAAAIGLVGPRHMGLSVRLCRTARPGDTVSLDGACVAAGVFHHRVVYNFVVAGDGGVARHSVDLFTAGLLAAAALEPELVFIVPGVGRCFKLYVELFEMAPARS